MVASYLIGSIPWSFIFAKIFSGKDIRKQGTKNVSTTNAWKIAGPVAGVLSFAYVSLIVGALSATVVEGFGSWLNDNLTIASMAAFFMWFVNI
ncbi:glycerol-3-phosphate acyltransferase [Petrotoga sp. DB-2]